MNENDEEKSHNAKSEFARHVSLPFRFLVAYGSSGCTSG